MLHPAKGLSPADLAAIADLEARTVAADGGRLKLEWGSLRSRRGDKVEDLLWWDGARLLGFLGLYSFGAPTVELAGMVDPVARRRGIGTALVHAALPLCRERGYDPALLVVPGDTPAGRAFAGSLKATADHSEYALRLDHSPTSDAPTSDSPTDGRIQDGIQLRAARPADIAPMTVILAECFGFTPAESDFDFDADRNSTLIIERQGQTVGTLRLSLDGAAGGVYGFAVDPAFQGQGIGREALRQACVQLRARGADHIGLEVAVENERALGLYTSLGFTRVTTEDYYALPMNGVRPPR